MKDTPFLFHFRKTLPASPQTKTDELTIYYSLDRRVNVLASGEIAWSSLFRKYPTTSTKSNTKPIQFPTQFDHTSHT